MEVNSDMILRIKIINFIEKNDCKGLVYGDRLF